MVVLLVILSITKTQISGWIGIDIDLWDVIMCFYTVLL